MRLGRLPSIKDLTIRTCRSEKNSYDVLERLTEQKHIEWSRESPGEIRLLEAWERKTGIGGKINEL